MKRSSCSILGSATCLAVLLFNFAAPSAQAAVIGFGSGGNQFSMEFVEIGEPNNAADTDPNGDPNSAGAVSYVYNIGKFEVSRDMVDKASAAGNLGITLHDLTTFGGNGANRPATGVSWNEAARFINWLNTSQGHLPAYKFAAQPGDGGYSANSNIELWTAADTGYDASNPFRNSEAEYFLPSVDEWYKAAFYDPVSDTYFNFPTGSDTAPTSVAGGTDPGTAVYSRSQSHGPADITNAGGLSPFGVMAMGGNATEWDETESDLTNDDGSSKRWIRGGAWSYQASTLAVSFHESLNPTFEGFLAGFRVASAFSEPAGAPVPEPSTFVLGSMLLGLLACRRAWKSSR